ncbi:MAG: hypothetical protein IPG68_01620 [Micrococcales bacterium]|nr:hypothetical protein [Micrococcales bacterium]
MAARTGVAVLAVVLGIALAGAGTATAARFITSKDIKNGTIKAKDLSPGLRALKRTGARGPREPRTQGDPRTQGRPGAARSRLLTFADSAVNGRITLSGGNQVVTSTAQQLDQRQRRHRRTTGDSRRAREVHVTQHRPGEDARRG